MKPLQPHSSIKQNNTRIPSDFPILSVKKVVQASSASSFQVDDNKSININNNNNSNNYNSDSNTNCKFLDPKDKINN